MGIFKAFGVGVLIGGAAVAAYALSKREKEIKEKIEEIKQNPTVSKAADKVKTTASDVKKVVFNRPAKLTGKDWYDKGMSMLLSTDDKYYLVKAKECFENASAMGYAEGTRLLAEMYAQGLGVEQDRIKSFELYRSAAEAGDEESWTQLAICYAEGVGTVIDPLDAFYWFAMAAAAGDETAKEVLGDLAEDITDRLSYPIEDVRAWYDSYYPVKNEEEAAERQVFWDNCEEEAVEVDTDFFADDDDVFIENDLGEVEFVDGEEEVCETCCCDAEPKETCCCDAEPKETCCCEAEPKETCCCDAEPKETCCCDAEPKETCCCEAEPKETCCCDAEPKETCCCDAEPKETCCCGGEEKPEEACCCGCEEKPEE